MASTAFLYGSNAFNLNASYSDWNTPAGVLQASGESTNSITDKEEESDKLQVEDYGSPITEPSDLVQGIEVEVIRRANSNLSIIDTDMELVLPNVVGQATIQVSENKANPTAWSNSNETIVYGGPWDLWGLLGMRAEHTDDVYARFKVENDLASGTATARVASLRLKFYYEPVRKAALILTSPHAYVTNISNRHNSTPGLVRYSASQSQVTNNSSTSTATARLVYRSNHLLAHTLHAGSAGLAYSGTSSHQTHETKSPVAGLIIGGSSSHQVIRAPVTAGLIYSANQQRQTHETRAFSAGLIYREASLHRVVKLQSAGLIYEGTSAHYTVKPLLAGLIYRGTASHQTDEVKSPEASLIYRGKFGLVTRHSSSVGMIFGASQQRQTSEFRTLTAGIAYHSERPEILTEYRLVWSDDASDLATLSRSLIIVQLQMADAIELPRITATHESTGETVPVMIRAVDRARRRLKLAIQPQRTAAPSDILISQLDYKPR